MSHLADVLRAKRAARLRGQTDQRGPLPYPEPGDIFPMTTPAGVRFYRVERSNDFRVTLVPLTLEETKALGDQLQAKVNYVQRQRAPWWRRLGRRKGRRA